jgi:hypothetical protein
MLCWAMRTPGLRTALQSGIERFLAFHLDSDIFKGVTHLPKVNWKALGAISASRATVQPAETPRLGAATREGRQGDRASLPSQPGPISGGVDCGIRALHRTRGPALPYPAPWPADGSHSPAPGQCAHDDPAAGTSCWTQNQDQRPQLPRNGHHHLPSERREARDRQQMAGH